MQRCGLASRHGKGYLGLEDDDDDCNNNDEDDDKAVAAAKAAFETFSQTSVEYRADLLDKIMAGLQARMGDMAEAISDEMGAPMWLANTHNWAYRSVRPVLAAAALRQKARHSDKQNNPWVLHSTGDSTVCSGSCSSAAAGFCSGKYRAPFWPQAARPKRQTNKRRRCRTKNHQIQSKNNRQSIPAQRPLA